MARITRKLQKIFALNAGNNGVFGSAADGTKVLSDDPDTIQSKAAWLTGWLTAVIGTKKFPPLEEFQAIQYLTTRQIAYLFQEGIPEWEFGTTYYLNSIVRKAGTYQLYGSKIDGNVGLALPSMVDNANWEFLTDLSASYAQATESVAGIAEIATAAEVKAGLDDQRFVTSLKLAPYAPQTGFGQEHWLNSLPSGWIWANGTTIGNAASNATGRANADTEALFTGLWNTYPYAGSTANASQGQLQVYTSAGVAVARGVSAAADFAANRTIAVIDKRGRSSAGKDNMGGAAPAGRLSGQTYGVNGLVLGAAGGQELHQLVIAELASHNHESDYYGGTNQSNGPTNIGAPLNAPMSLNGVTGSRGGDTPHNNVQPTVVCNYIIKL